MNSDRPKFFGSLSLDWKVENSFSVFLFCFSVPYLWFSMKYLMWIICKVFSAVFQSIKSTIGKFVVDCNTSLSSVLENISSNFLFSLVLVLALVVELEISSAPFVLPVILEQKVKVYGIPASPLRFLSSSLDTQRSRLKLLSNLNETSFFCNLLRFFN